MKRKKQKGNLLYVILACLLVLIPLLIGCQRKTSVPEIELFSTKPENLATLQQLVGKFNDTHNDVHVTINAPSDAGTVLRTKLTKDRIPDVIAMGGDATYTELESAGIFTDLSSESFTDHIPDGYKEMVYELNKNYKRKLYGVPFATNASGLLYNRDIFAQYAMTPPETWDALIADAKTLKSRGITPFYMTYKDSWTTMPPWNALSSAIQPSDFNTGRRNGKYTFAHTEAFQEIAQKFIELSQYAENDYVGIGYSDGNIAFANGKAAMYVMGTYAIPDIKKANAKINIGSIPFPSTNDVSKNRLVAGIDVMLTVSTESKYQKQDKELIAYLMEAQNGQTYVNQQFAFSPVKGVVQNDPSVSELRDILEKGDVVSYPDHYYPDGIDLSAYLQQYASDKNVKSLFQSMDRQYDKTNQLVKATS